VLKDATPWIWVLRGTFLSQAASGHLPGNVSAGVNPLGFLNSLASTQLDNSYKEWYNYLEEC